MTLAVLAYHSHNISGTEYAMNDHVALANDLRVLSAAGARIVALSAIVDAMRDPASLVGAGPPRVGLTFDDGPSFDFADFEHPQFGRQRSFLNILRDFRAEAGDDAQPALHATSFVIASPEARAAMARAEECGYAYLDDWLSDAWWNEAVASGLMAIGNHSWDHVHPVPESIATVSQERGDFTRVDNHADADREIRAATQFINERIGGRCEMFAYPYGHVNGYLARDYLPNRRAEHGMAAAFGTGGRAIAPGDSIWNIPRAVCGYHWKSPADLLALLGT